MLPKSSKPTTSRRKEGNCKTQHCAMKSLIAPRPANHPRTHPACTSFAVLELLQRDRKPRQRKAVVESMWDTGRHKGRRIQTEHGSSSWQRQIPAAAQAASTHGSLHSTTVEGNFHPLSETAVLDVRVAMQDSQHPKKTWNGGQWPSKTRSKLDLAGPQWALLRSLAPPKGRPAHCSKEKRQCHSHRPSNHIASWQSSPEHGGSTGGPCRREISSSLVCSGLLESVN